MSQTKAQLISDLVQALNFTGTASAPANGLFLSAANTLQLSTASTPRLTINSDGHVDVVGNLDVGAGIDVTGTITGTGDMTIDTNTLHVDSSNNRVGIGTTSPGAPLHINTGSSGLPKIRLEHTGAGNDVFEITSGIAGISNSGFGIYDVGETAYRIVIDTNGKVGIGTTAPDTLLHLAGGSPYIKLHNTGSSASADDIFGAILFQHADADDPGITAKIQCVAEDNAGNSFLAFYNGDGGNADERLRITSAGDVTFGIQSGGGAPTSSSQIRHFDLGRDHWNSTAGDYRALRLKVYHASNDDVYGIGISSNLLEIQSQQNIGFFAGSAGGGTGRRIERARIDATNGRLQLSSTTLRIDNAIVPESHAQLNIGSTGSSETRAIDIDGNWGNGEHKSITFTHGTSTSDIVGQINCVHNSPDSSLRFGKLYHGGNSTAYTMTLDSTSTTGADLTLHNGNLIFADGHGINFQNVAGSASGSTSALLDDYEEGTFTPAVTSGLSAGQIAYNSRSAKYTKVGNTVYFTFHMNISSATLDSGSLKFGGLPFTAVNTSHTTGGAWKIFTNGNIDANATYKVEGNTTDIAVRTAAGDAMAANATSINAGNRHMAYWGFYFV